MNDVNGSGWIIAMVISAVISCIASLAVIVTFFIFRDLRYSPFMRIVTYVSIADFFGNIGYLRINKPASGSAACVIQAFLNSSFYPCGWLWTTTLTYFLYHLATEGNTPKSFFWFNIICWGLPITLFLIQTPFTEFESPGDYNFEVCEVGGRAGLIYSYITYYGMYFSSLFIMMYFLWKISLLESKQSEGTKVPAFQVAKSALTLYPSWMTICWLPHIITVFVLDFLSWGGYGWDVIYFLGDILKILHGGIAAVIFFYKSKEARRLWYRLLFNKNPEENNGHSVEIRSPSEFVENFIHSPSIVFATKHDPMSSTDTNTFSISDSDL